MLCGGLSRAGSYKVGIWAHHPKVALVRKPCQGTKDTRCMEAHIIVLTVINFYENTNLRPICRGSILCEAAKYDLLKSNSKHNSLSHTMSNFVLSDITESPAGLPISHVVQPRT
ncbi:hypothetical protein AMECASPLE_013344 [Ameca splendens]|uniref:Uncharacterized protein n=1 Tax=Ameca splendens TaxID=208324 RepID=A0ABV0YC87_9TELE